MPNKRCRGRPRHPDILTAAEWRVVEAVRHGLTNPQIAALQGVSKNAVKYHVGNILQKLGFSTRAKLRNWSGIRGDSKLFKRKLIATEDHVKLATIGQISRNVRNIEAATTWYGDVLGLEHLYSFGKLAFFDCGGVRLFLSETDAGGTDSIIYFSVPDIHAAQVELGKRGIEFINAPHMIHKHADGAEEWMAFFKDNEERPLAIMSRVG